MAFTCPLIETVEYASAVPIALSWIATVFFTAFATFTGTARSGPTAAVLELQETLATDAVSISANAANRFPLFLADDFFITSFTDSFSYSQSHGRQSGCSLEFPTSIL